VQTRTIDLVAGEWRSEFVPLSAFFMLLDTVAAVDVEFSEEVGSSPETARGIESGFLVRQGKGDPIGFLRFYSSVTQAIKFGYSNREADSKKVTSTVSVVDGSGEVVVRGEAFAAVIRSVAGVSRYPHIQLYNPAGSGVNLFVTKAKLNQQSGGNVSLKLGAYSTQLSTVEATYGISNKDLSSASLGSAEARREEPTSILGSLGSLVDLQVVPIYEPFDVLLPEPVLIRPGAGLLGWAGVANVTLDGIFHYYEAVVA